MKIFLDDIRYPFWIYDNPDDWIVVRNFEEFKILVDKRNDIKTISFDNDLGIDENN